MSKLTTTNKVYWTLIETGLPVEEVNRIFTEKGWKIPSAKRGRTTARPTNEQILNGQVKLPVSASTVAVLMQTLVNNYGVPIDWLAQYLRPVSTRNKLGSSVVSVDEDAEAENETEESTEYEDSEEEEVETEEENEYVSIF